MRKAYLVAIAAMVLVGGALFADAVKCGKCDPGQCANCPQVQCAQDHCQNCRCAK